MDPILASTVRVILCRIRRHTKTAFAETNRFSTNPPVWFFPGWDQRNAERIVILHHIWRNQKCEMLRSWEKPLTKPNKCCCFYAALALPSKSLCSGFQDTEGESSLFYDLPIKISQTKAVKVGVGGSRYVKCQFMNKRWSHPLFKRQPMVWSYLKTNLYQRPLHQWGPAGLSLWLYTKYTHGIAQTRIDTVCFISAIWQLFIHKIFNQTHFPL